MSEKTSICWLFQAITGFLMLVFGTVHILRNHLEGSMKGLLTRKEVLMLLKRPEIAILEASFMIAISYHAVYGIRSILIDLGVMQGKEKIADKIFTLLALIMAGYGLVLLTYLVLTPP
ncbi:MAG: hypothetical protein DRJ36_01970 [Thermoprotei archaeon]|nr:MAG: hypothetical protein DRJ36_01970 [Thermoprotei archaeon]